MSEFKKLFHAKRILAMILAIAMAVTSIPATANAAPLQPQAEAGQTADDASVTDNTDGEQPDDSQSTVPSDESNDQESGAQGSGDDSGAGNDADIEDGSAAGDDSNAGNDPAAGDDSNTGNDPAAGDDANAGDDSNAGDNSGTGNTPGDTEGPGTTEPAEPAEAEKEYTFSFNEDLDAYTTAQYNLGEARFATETEAADGVEAGMTVNSNILRCITLQNVKDEDDSYNLSYNSYADIVQALTYVWKHDGQEMGKGKSPKEAGSYQLVIRLGAKSGEYKAAETTIDFRITRAKVNIGFGVSEVNPGDPVSAVALSYASAEAADGKTFTYQTDDKNTDADETKDNEVAFGLVVKEAATDVVLQSGDKLVKNKEYVVKATAKFVGEKASDYDKNYELIQPDEQSIVVNDLIKTGVKLTLNAKYNNAEYKKESSVSTKDQGQKIDKITIKSYDGNAVAATEPQLDKIEVGVPGTDKDGKETFDVITGVETKAAWHSAVYESWTEGTERYCNLTTGGELDGAPVDAGIYVYRVTYEGDDGQVYASSSADVVVEIEAVELIMQPKFDTATKSFYDGQTAADVLAEVSYELPYADKEGKFTIPEDKKASFWGTSFVDSLRTQPYEPVFEVVKTVVSTVDGKQVSRTTTLSAMDALEYDEKGATTYEVRFTGDKAVYNANGSVYDSKSVNDPADSTNQNYSVNTDQDTLEKYVVKFEVKNVNAVIDTDAIAAGLDRYADFHEAAGKTYDGLRLFTNRSDYKKAQLKTKDTNASVSGVSSTDLTYRWYSSSYKTVMDTKVRDENGKFRESDYFESSFTPRYDLISPVNAGIYKLVITYQDKEGRYFAEPAEVYFVIKQQTLQIKLGDTTYSEYSGITAGQFLDETEIDYSIIPELDSPAPADFWEEEGYSYSGYPFAYSVEWQVEEKQRDTEGNALKDEHNKDIYEPLQSYERFLYDVKHADDSYRLSVADFTCYNSNYTVSETIIEDVKDPDDPDAAVTQRKVTTNLSRSDENTAKITVTQMGTTQLRMEGMVTKERDYNGVSIYDVLKDDLKNVRVVKENDDGTTTEVTDLALTYQATDYESGVSIPLENLSEEEFSGWALYDQLINGGYYEITAQYRGDETYAPMYETTIACVEVNAIPLTITPPVLEDTFVAGQRAYEVENKAAAAFGTANVDGFLLRDAPYFKKSELSYSSYGYERFYGYGYSAWFYDWGDGEYEYNLPCFSVYDEADQTALYSYDVLKGANPDRYKLVLEEYRSGQLTGRCARNYYPVCGEASDLAVVRGNAQVSAVSYSNIPDVDTTDSITGMSHRFTVLDGISHTSFNGEEGNFVAVEIIAPAEYVNDNIWGSAVYEASIKEAGGDIVRGSHYNYSAGRYAITAVFDAGKGAVQFGIRWEEDYIETFELAFSKDMCLGNLDDAVSPKSIAFNAPNKTMVVGATQNLDVKITKVQKDDVICLGYEVTKGQEYLCVNEYGKVTALKAGGSATVTVYPMHLVNGVKVPIDDPKAKKASVTIAVKEVTAPRLSKVTPLDYSVTVQYPYVKDVDYNYGYRREIYVLEGNNLKEQDFKNKIDAMSNEQWKGIFAVAPVFLNNSQEYSRRVYDIKKHTYINTVEYKLTGLKPNTAYTVYVRNVSAVRTLSDGCQVSESAAGSVKGFITTKSQVKDLEVTLKNKDGQETDKEGQIGHSLEWIEYAKVQLSEGSVQLQVKGYFEAWAMDPAAEPTVSGNGYNGYDITSDQPYELPLSGAYKGYYVDPKISYYFWTYADREGCYDAYTGREVTPGNYYRSATSSIASIDKKGRLTLKQPGWVELVAVDTVSGIWSNQIDIKINAEADAVKGKTTTLQVGQSVRLENLIEYKEGKKILDQSCYNTYGRVDRTGLKAQIEKDGYLELSDNGYITAVKGKGSVRATLTDTTLNQSVQVTIKTAELAPVKNLKCVDVIDNRFTVQFERSPYAEAYRIDVKNARGSLIRSIYAEDYKVNGIYNRYDEEIYDNDSDWDDDYRQGDWHCYYDRKTKKTYGEYTIRNLTQQSKYTVTVQALYKESAPSKTASKSVTTTKLPASERELEKDDFGGINIYVWNYNGHTIGSHPFVSGNDYTLVAEPDNWGAKYAATDTLIWSSSNKKAATVKANAGSYSATLKAVRNGDTTIEVKSRITGKVIARYKVAVRNVGDAYAVNFYYGDNEDLRGDGTAKDPAYTELTLGNPAAVDLGQGQSKWFAFTAPETGKYSFYRMDNGSESTYGFTVYDAARNSIGRTPDLTEGQTVYVEAKSIGSYTMNVEKLKGAGPSDRTPLETGAVTMQVTNGQYFVFTAEGEGLYRFNGPYFRVEDTEGNYKTSGYQPQCWLDAGETVYLCAQSTGQYVINIEQVPIGALTADADPAQVNVDEYGKAWFSFTAPKAAEYEFVLSGGGYNKHIYLYNRSNISESFDGDTYWTYEDIALSCMLGSGATVLIEAGPSGSTLSVKTKAVIEPVKEEGKNVTLTDADNYFEFAAPSDGFYRFSSTGAVNGTEARLYKDLTGNPVDSQTNYSGDFAVSCYLKSGQQGYLRAKSYYGDEQENVTIKVEKLTPGVIGEEGADSEIAANSDKWFGFTAGETGKYTFSLSGDGSCTASLYTLSALGSSDPAFVKVLYLYNGKKRYDYEVQAGQTVYWRVRNNSSYSSVNVTVKAEKYTIPTLEEGSADFDIEARTEQIVTFTAAEAGKYNFKFSSNSSDGFWAYLYKDASLSNNITSVYINEYERTYSYNAAAGETLYWKLNNTTYSDVTVTVSVEKFTINTMTDGTNTFTVSGNSSKYFSYTAQEDGEYIFAFKSDDGKPGYAYKYSDMYFNNCETSTYFSSSSYGSATFTLSEQETVYWAIENNYGSDMNVTAIVRKDVPTEVTADGASAEVSSGLEQWFSFTADENEDARYRFTFTSDTSNCYAYFYRDRDDSSSGSITIYTGSSVTDDRYIEAGKTVYWKVRINSSYSDPTTVTVKAEKIPMEEVTEENPAAVPISSNAVRLFSIALPESDAEYVITAMSTDAYCYAYLYSDLSMSDDSWINTSYNDYGVSSGDGSSKNWYVSSADVGSKVYLKVTNSDSSNDTRFTVSVKKRTVESVTENSSAVTIAPGAEQWFSFTSAEDTRYAFTLASDAEECDWYLYEGEEESSAKYNQLGTSSDTTADYYISSGSIWRCKVKNRSISNSTSVTVTAKAIDITEISAAEDMDAVEIAPNSAQWFKYSAEEAGRCQFTFTTTEASCYVYRYSDLTAEEQIGNALYVSSSNNVDYYVSGTTYFKVASSSYNSSSTEFTVKAEPYTVETLDPDSGCEFETTSRWLQFTAAADGVYSFSNQEGTSSYNRHLSLYKELSDTDYVQDVNYANSIEYSMCAGETVYLKVWSNNGNNVTGTLKVVQHTVADLSLDSDVTVSLENKLGFAKFSAAETGVYSFKPAGLDADTSAVGYMYLHADVDNASYIQYISYSSSSTDSLVYPLAAGDTIYVRVNASNSGAAELKVSVTKEPMDMTEITVDQEYSFSWKQDEENWIFFKADEEQYQYYMNGAWDSSAELNIWCTTSYSPSTWNQTSGNPTYKKYQTFSNQSIYTYGKDSIVCICIKPTEDVDITFSIATSYQ